MRPLEAPDPSKAEAAAALDASPTEDSGYDEPLQIGGEEGGSYAEENGSLYDSLGRSDLACESEEDEALLGAPPPPDVPDDHPSIVRARLLDGGGGGGDVEKRVRKLLAKMMRVTMLPHDPSVRADMLLDIQGQLQSVLHDPPRRRRRRRRA